MKSAMFLDRYNSEEDFLMDEDFRRWVLEPDHEDVLHIAQWIEKHPEKKQLWEKAVEIIKIVEIDNIENDQVKTDAQWARISGSLHEESQDGPPARKVFFDFRSVQLYKYAAAAILVGLLIFYVQYEKYNHYATAYGEKQRLELPDGSTLILNSNSSLKTRIDTKNEIREVWVDGEAFFEIQRIQGKEKKIPFFVYAGDLKIEVLGTGFNVFNRGDKVQVVLEHGSVAVSARDDERIVLKPSELIEIKDNEISREVVDTELFNSWKENKWLFKDAPLSAIVGRIEEIYGVSVAIGDTGLATETMSGTLPSSSLDALLNAVCKIYGTEVIENGNALRLQRRIR